MDVWRHIAGRLLEGSCGRGTLSGPVVKLARASVALGMAVMIIAICVGVGFKEEIRRKLIGFGSNITITQFDYNQSFETNPVTADPALMNRLTALEGVHTVQTFSIKPGIIKTPEAVQAIALKGVDQNYNTDFITEIMTEGSWIYAVGSAWEYNTDSLNILLSATLAQKLGLRVGDPVRMYFVQNGVRARKFTLCGLYDSHLAEYDEHFAFVPQDAIRRLNQWEKNQASGIEVGINSFDDLDKTAEQTITEVMLYENTQPEKGELLRIMTIRDIEAQMFAWLDLLDTNIAVILALIIAVAGLNMTTGLLILILERTQTIGLLKAIGAGDGLIRRIFLRMALSIVGKGMLWGNAAGLFLCAVQKFTHLLTLNPHNYYLDNVPISFDAPMLAGLNLTTVAIMLALLLGPTYVISRIRPSAVLRFD